MECGELRTYRDKVMCGNKYFPHIEACVYIAVTDILKRYNKYYAEKDIEVRCYRSLTKFQLLFKDNGYPITVKKDFESRYLSPNVINKCFADDGEKRAMISMCDTFLSVSKSDKEKNLLYLEDLDVKKCKSYRTNGEFNTTDCGNIELFQFDIRFLSDILGYDIVEHGNLIPIDIRDSIHYYFGDDIDLFNSIDFNTIKGLVDFGIMNMDDIDSVWEMLK